MCACVCVCVLRVRSYNESSIGIGSTAAATSAFEENDLRSRSQGPGKRINIQSSTVGGRLTATSCDGPNGNGILSNMRG